LSYKALGNISFWSLFTGPCRLIPPPFRKKAWATVQIPSRYFLRFKMSSGKVFIPRLVPCPLEESVDFPPNKVLPSASFSDSPSPRELFFLLITEQFLSLLNHFFYLFFHRGKCHPFPGRLDEVGWVYFPPIFERSSSHSYSSQVDDSLNDCFPTNQHGCFWRRFPDWPSARKLTPPG